MTSSIKKGGYAFLIRFDLMFMCIFNKIEFNVFYVIMKRVPTITNFKQPIYKKSD